jgi:hypothetical protein
MLVIAESTLHFDGVSMSRYRGSDDVNHQKAVDLNRAEKFSAT